MKVPKPNFDSVGTPGGVRCKECPFADERGRMVDEKMAALCDGWHAEHDLVCPAPETYAEACALAEKEAAK